MGADIRYLSTLGSESAEWSRNIDRAEMFIDEYKHNLTDLSYKTLKKAIDNINKGNLVSVAHFITEYTTGLKERFSKIDEIRAAIDKPSPWRW